MKLVQRLTTAALGLTVLIAIVTVHAADKPTSNPSPTFDELVARAESAARKTFADLPWLEEELKAPPRITRYPDRWHVTWTLPSNTAGGMPVVTLNLGSLDVIKVWHEQ